MPVSLPRISRRRFLATSLAAAAGAFGRSAFGETASADPHRFVLLSDTHIPSGPGVRHRGTDMTANMRRVVQELTALQERPAGVLISGDCAFSSGQVKEYAHLVRLLGPLRETGYPVHAALGNHDHRERFWEAVPVEQKRERVIADRHVTVVPAARANWFLLDSLDVTAQTPGALGERQVDWVAAALDAHADKPAVIVVHHHPDANNPYTLGLRDTVALYEVLLPRKHVKAVIFGHTHDWKTAEHEGIHLVNLPPVAYVFRAGRPNGWVDARLEENGMALELRSLDPRHKQHGEAVQLTWRT